VSRGATSGLRGAFTPERSDGRREGRIALAKPLISGVKKSDCRVAAAPIPELADRANLISIKSILTGL